MDDPVIDAITTIRRLRLAVGLFRDAGALQTALRELRKAGFAAEQLAIVARQDTLVKLGWPRVESPEHEMHGPDLQRFRQIDVSENAAPLLVSHGEIAQLVADWRNCWRNWTGRKFPCVLDPWLDRTHACVLQRQLDDGAVTLWVRVGDGGEELRACRTLLRTSAERVQVHDITGAP